MAKVTWVITDETDEKGRPGVHVEAYSDDVENRASMANLATIYLGEKWNDIMAAARAHALTAFAKALAERDAAAAPTQH